VIYFLKQRQPIDLCNGEVRRFLCGTGWIINYCLEELLALKGLCPMREDTVVVILTTFACLKRLHVKKLHLLRN
jgi:hypothetical protein